MFTKTFQNKLIVFTENEIFLSLLFYPLAKTCDICRNFYVSITFENIIKMI